MSTEETRVESAENEPKSAPPLSKAEEQYRSIFDAASDAMFIIDEAGRFVDVNPRACTMYGYSKDELLALSVPDLVHPDYHVEFNKFRENIARTGKTLNQTKDVRKDGTFLDTEVNGTEFYFRGKRHLLAIVRDVTERNRVEKNLRDSLDRFRELMELLPQTIFEMDFNGNVLFINQYGMDTFEVTTADLEAGVNAFHFLIPDDRPRARQNLERILKGEEPRANEYRVIRKDQKTFPALIRSIVRYRDQVPVGFTSFCIDISREKKLEAQFREAQKMEGIGTLAGGIAHDFNNLLMGIQGHVSLMMFDLATSHPFYHNLQAIDAIVQRGATLTQQLLGFARGGKYEVIPTDVNRLVQKSASLFGRTKKEISIHSDFQEDLWPVDIDRGQIDQVLLNLYVNAWQAMSEGGDLFLRTENVEIEADYAASVKTRPGRFVRISVTDTGIGIPKAIQSRIFEPFFTTKTIGKGTGLGLASSYGIIKNHGGFITVYSEEGKGATFSLYLPASNSVPREQLEPKQEFLKGKETVLIVDDEEIVLTVGKKLLQILGYQVFEARDGKTALEIYRHEKDNISLVILDMIMPEMGGNEVYEHLREINPTVKVLLSSGYSLNGQAAEILNKGCRGFIQKPFNIEQVSRKIREVLDSEDA